ncbi:MAG: threonylcarbamoyl-AMP synthase, partial [Planktothrix sp.]
TTEEEGQAPIALPIETQIDKAKLYDSLGKLVDIIVDDTSDPGYQVSTIIDLTADEPAIARKGKGWEEAEQWLEA